MMRWRITKLSGALFLWEMPLMRGCYKSFMKRHRDLQGYVTGLLPLRLLSPSWLPIGHSALATWPPFWSLEVAGSLLTQGFAFVIFSPWYAPPTQDIPMDVKSQKVFPGCPIENVHLVTLLAIHIHMYALYYSSFLFFILAVIFLKHSFRFYWFFLLLSVSLTRF